MVSLHQGSDSLSVNKPTGVLMFGLGWDPTIRKRIYGGLFGGSNNSMNLDASCVTRCDKSILFGFLN